MKKINLIIVTLLSFMILFTNIDVEAKRLATCTYKTNKNLINGIIEGVNVVVDVYDDKTVKAKIKLGEWSDTPTSGSPIASTSVFQQFDKNTFKKNGYFYKKFKEINSCPEMQFIFYINSSQLHINVDGKRDSNEYPNETVKPIITNKDNSIFEEQIVCSKRLYFNDNSKVSVTFYKVGDIKKFRVEEGGGTATSEANDIASGTNAYYKINEEDVGSYWESTSKCKSTPLHAALQNTGAKPQYLLRSKEPSSEINAGSKNDCENSGKGGCLPEESKGEKIDNICSIFDNDMIELTKKIIGYIQIGTVFLALVLGILDFVGAIGSDKDNAFKDAGKKFLKRLVAVALVFLVPAILGIILSFISVANECNIDIFG